jgi:hypothetical protein
VICNDGRKWTVILNFIEGQVVYTDGHFGRRTYTPCPEKKCIGKWNYDADMSTGRCIYVI